MARTGRTPRAIKQREGNYVNPGVIGRATGLTVAPLGPRDEHGMEPVSGLFSSPEKSPPKRNGVLQPSAIDEEEDETMNIGSSMSSSLSLAWYMGKTRLPKAVY